ncbi:hypothetical protein FOZ60_003554 [Perkinsus olseni]|uniref:Uncharacterized protein n=1 Tax=Perkinsus olseni TaxID=32597 RepID=A0A7J6NV92_PEROL|nr:hypothetical protein FOZ60_003554 [Perkinsus olseni]
MTAPPNSDNCASRQRSTISELGARVVGFGGLFYNSPPGSYFVLVTHAHLSLEVWRRLSFTTPFLKATPFLTGESPHEFLIDETRLPSRHGFQGSSASPRSVVREVTSAMESIPGVTIVTSDSDDPNPHEKEAVDTAAD